MDIALHRSASDIEEDLEYYFSDPRDEHNQIRPSDEIRSFTTDSSIFEEDPGEDEVGNVFYPFAPFTLDRIFIGISNIWAENDGVMSMRVGRRWPPVIPSIARWLFGQTPRCATALALKSSPESVERFWKSETRHFWHLGRHRTVIEQIIRSRHGPRRSVRLAAVGANTGVLALECLFSPYANATQAHVSNCRESSGALMSWIKSARPRRIGLQSTLVQTMPKGRATYCASPTLTLGTWIRPRAGSPQAARSS